jgi:peroxiredoxin
VTFVIDKAGVVRLAFNALLVSDDHVKKALAAVAAIASDA